MYPQFDHKPTSVKNPDIPYNIRFMKKVRCDC